MPLHASTCWPAYCYIPCALVSPRRPGHARSEGGTWGGVSRALHSLMPPSNPHAFPTPTLLLFKVSASLSKEFTLTPWKHYLFTSTAWNHYLSALFTPHSSFPRSPHLSLKNSPPHLGNTIYSAISVGVEQLARPQHDAERAHGPGRRPKRANHPRHARPQ